MHKKKPKTCVLDFFSSVSRYVDLSIFRLSSLSGSLFAVSLCLSGSCLLSSLLCSSSELSGSSSTLLCDLSGDSLVGLNLLSEEGLGSSSFLVCLCLADLTGLGIFLSFPGIETLLSLFLAESAFSYTALQVFAKQYALVGEDSTNGVRRLSTTVNPVQCTLEIEDYGCGVGVGVERTDTLDVLAVTRRTAVSYYDVIESVVFVAMTGQTNFCCHLFEWFVGLELRESYARVNK